jgi:hypothetical protein
MENIEKILLKSNHPLTIYFLRWYFLEKILKKK